MRNESEEEVRARRVLVRLKEAETALCRVDGCYRLSSQSTHQEMRVAESLIALCMRRDWLRRNGQDLVLSEAGRAWLSRCKAGAADPFRQQHQRRAVKLREVDGARRQVMVNETESPLGWLKGRKDRAGRPLLSDPQYEAGERLRTDYWFAQLNQRVTANWSALAPSDRSRRAAPPDAASLRDNVIAAKERVSRALKAVGPELAGVLIDVCCELKGLEEAERNQGWPQRAGKVVLQIALSRLARHYGFERTDAMRGRDGGRRVRHWGSVDYRPTLDAWRSTEDQ
ncbi:MAG: DUF6456 domain-containing protein [Methyloceanibacter sp.]